MFLLPDFSPKARNSCCSICGQGPGRQNPLSPISPNRPVVDSGVEIDWEGSFEFCLNCAAEAGALAGMIPEAEAEALREAAEAAERRCADAEAALADADSALVALVQYVA